MALITRLSVTMQELNNTHSLRYTKVEGINLQHKANITCLVRLGLI